jgi:hypothetical protein
MFLGMAMSPQMSGSEVWVGFNLGAAIGSTIGLYVTLRKMVSL